MIMSENVPTRGYVRLTADNHLIDDEEYLTEKGIVPATTRQSLKPKSSENRTPNSPLVQKLACESGE